MRFDSVTLKRCEYSFEFDHQGETRSSKQAATTTMPLTPRMLRGTTQAYQSRSLNTACRNERSQA